MTAKKTKPRRAERGCGCATVKLALLFLLVAGAGGYWVWQSLGRPYQGFAGESTRLTIEPGTPAVAILEQLERGGVLPNAFLARGYLVYWLGDPPLQAGQYEFVAPSSPRQVLAKLVAGDVVRASVTVVEGLTLVETAEHLAREGFGSREALLAAMRSPQPISDLDPEALDLEGYLFPDTYSLAEGMPPRAVVAAMVANFRTRYREEIAPGLPAQGGLTLRRLVTLASIVEKEAQRPEERPLIAAVYRNRLRDGIGLYADPTVIYALKRLERWNGNLTRADLALDSPYNTYRYGGLPPGPIASPGLASLAAAANPAPATYLYFVSRNDGSHVFADTLAEHNRNVDRWQRQYWRERWAAEGRGR